MPLREKNNINNIKINDRFNTSNSYKCDCDCKNCRKEIQFLRQQLLELHTNISERRVTRQSLNASLSSNAGEKNLREVSAKGCNCKKSCSNRCGCYKKDFACGKNCKCNKDSCKNQVQEIPQEKLETQNESLDLEKEAISHVTTRNTRKVPLLVKPDDQNDLEIDENFDPMKPRRQLPRSPIPIKNSLSVNDNFVVNDPEPRPFPMSSVSNVNVSLANASIKSMASDLPEELYEIVDWEKHKAELKQCPKCRRKFLPNRLEKHKMICKGV